MAAAVLLIACDGLQNAAANGDTRTISLHHVHTNEDLTITFKRDGRYDPEALKKINWLLRDWRRDEEAKIDPLLLDLLWEVQRDVGAAKPVNVICGYRAPQTNAMLRRRSGGVAQFSQHTSGRAIDFFIPGVALEDLRNIGLRLQRGGIGFYPTSGSPFVHLDIGNVRHWPPIGREELVRVFPDGRTVHIPGDGQPLPGYALALADIEGRGNEPSASSLNAARLAGMLDRDDQKSSVKLLARLLGIGKSGEDIETTGSIGGKAAPAPAPASLPQRKVAKIEMAATPATMARPAQAKPAAQKLVAAAVTKVAAAPLPLPAAMFNDDAIPSRALAYAPVPGPELNARPGALPQAKATPAAPIPSAAFIPLETSIAVKQPAGKPTLVHTRREIQLAERFDDPWLRAAILAPDLRHHMTAEPIGTPDYRSLSVFMQSPSASVTMAFSADPNLGLAADRFSGRAVVFLATTAFKTRTASLR